MSERPGETRAAPLVVTRDESLLAEVVRLTAAAGVSPEILRDPEQVLSSWPSASLVLLGSDAAGLLARHALPRRTGVHVLALDDVSDAVYRDALGCGAESVLVLPEAGGWLVDALTDAGDGDGGAGVVIGVVGAAGGVGATTFAAALAQVLAASGPALAIDADAAGAGLDQVLGLEAEPGVRWEGLLQATGRLSARSLRDTVPARAGLSVLAWSADRTTPLTGPSMREVLSAGRRGYPIVVVDLPRQRDAVGEEALSRCDQVVLVSTTTVPAVSAAARWVRRLPAIPTHLVLRGHRGGVPVTDIERLLGHRAAIRMPDQRGLDEAISLGLGPLRSRKGPLASAARSVAGAVVDTSGGRR
ncbi:MAG TPA: septum site-determining protein Ssd [Marmoricola sp.]|jgi:secretion/DNA translocation related CpaE-like protein|nr:septum site-determining protein Ssd [Marmoricola sp.]